MIRQDAISDQIKMVITLNFKQGREKRFYTPFVFEKSASFRCHQGEEVGATGDVIADEIWHKGSVICRGEMRK